MKNIIIIIRTIIILYMNERILIWDQTFIITKKDKK